ncbi:MAG: hypothetical protein ACW960_05455 [Candidatus Thorarchaeota archaeon]|jgi:hypothetical protein
MLVVEDTAEGEVKRFLLADALIQLGEVQAGSQSRVFDPNRVLSFYDTVENQLHDYSSKYPEAFKYIPRRAYTYLKRPPILSELYHDVSSSDSGWFVDLFAVRPLLSLGETKLPLDQRKNNIIRTENWSVTPPFSSRLYRLQDMRYGSRGRNGWGAVMSALDLKESLRNDNRPDLLSYFKSELPLLIEMEKREDLDLLMEWLVFLKDAGLEAPPTLFSVRNHKSWNSEIMRLLQIPNSRLLLSGATITSFSSLVKEFRNSSGDSEWSKKFVFGSAYPETQKGDSITEILSFLLSNNLGATTQEVQRILAGNLLSMLPPRPPYYEYVDNTSSVIAEGLIGQASLGELSRIFRILAARKLQIIESFDYMITNEGGEVHLNDSILTVRNPISTTANTIVLLNEPDDSLTVSGWRKSLSKKSPDRDANPLKALVQSTARSEGPILESPSDINRFNHALLDCLKVKNLQEILSALHFKLNMSGSKNGALLMSEEDMRAVGVANGDLVLGMDAKEGQWWAGHAELDEECPQRTICVSKEDAHFLGLSEESVVDIVKSEGKIRNLEKAIFALDSTGGFSRAELLSYAYLHADRLQETLNGQILGKGTSIWINGRDAGASMTLTHSVPPLEPGELARLSGDALEFRPSQMFRPFNMILVISTDGGMGVQDIELKTIQSLKRRLSTLVSVVPEIDELLSGLGTSITRMNMATFAALLLIQSLSGNRSDGSLGIVTVSETPTKFSIQKGEIIQTSMQFSNDFASEDVLVSILYSLLDSSRDIGGSARLSGAFRAIAEFLEDFGSEMPTLVVLMANLGSETFDDVKPFLQVISSRNRYQIEILNLGEEAHSLGPEFKDINVKVHQMTSFAADVFEGYLANVIEELVPGSPDHSTSDVF